MNKTSIPWADLTWNPITGCTKGCDYCYARKVATRFCAQHVANRGYVDREEVCNDCGFTCSEERRPGSACAYRTRAPFPYGFTPTLYPHRLDEPLRLKKPSVIFLGSMGDLFDPAFPDEFRNRVLNVVWRQAQQHTYMVLTKQSERMREYITREWAVKGEPLPNLWLGVTVTNQADADERIPLLLGTPAAHRFVSVEPMLGPVDLRSWLHTFEDSGVEYGHGMSLTRVGRTVSRLDAVIVGAKTPGKPLHEDYGCFIRYTPMNDCRPGGCPRCEAYGLGPRSALRDLRDQCLEAGVHFHYKHGKHNPELDGVVYDWKPEVGR